jgi:hypothetical protein
MASSQLDDVTKNTSELRCSKSNIPLWIVICQACDVITSSDSRSPNVGVMFTMMQG